MKLFLKARSERGKEITKSGNDKLEIEITNEDRQLLADITVLPSGTIVIDEGEFGEVIVNR